MLNKVWKTVTLAALGGLLLLTGGVALAHPMGNFSISHYTRLEASEKQVTLRYVLDMAEIPTQGEKMTLDKNRDGVLSAQEKEAYLGTLAPRLRAGLTLTADGKPLALQVKPVGLELKPGAGGLETMRLTLDGTADLPTKGTTFRLAYRDGNYTERTGWREIVAVAGSGATLANASVPTTDISRELTAYPTDPGAVPLQVSEANFTLQVGGMGGNGVASPASPAPVTAPASLPNGRQDAFTQAIAVKELTLGIILTSLVLAFFFGAVHALSPGHGKAMVAAYLVGTRGTAKHAIFLGAVVTITHTIGVYVLGLITLFASRYVVPERLYPVLSALSGVAIVCIGVSLFRQRLQLMLANGHSHSHSHSHHDHHHHEDGHHHHHDHDHDLMHEGEEGHHHHHHHDHDHDHDHSHHHHHHGAGVVHDHGDGHYHSHDIPEEVSLKSLLVMGITGGALPCPTALVVMLGAIALHRVAFGLALIASFSLGLAAVLVAIGLMVVYTRGFLERLPLSGAMTYRLPVLSAALVTVVGLLIVVRSVSGNF